MNTISRRKFLKIGCASAAVTVPALIPGSSLGLSGIVAPSERITMAGIGICNRGTYDLTFFLDEPDVQFLAVADVRKDRREGVKAMVEGYFGSSVATYRDFREMLSRQDIDAVLIATGDRWHTVASVMAAKAGKDVYSEKPCAITIAQAGALAGTMRRCGRVFQAGTQRRSVPNFQFAVDLARSGKLGKLHTVHASIYELGETHDWLPPEPEPPRDIMDWDLWLGPAPWRPYNRQYVDGGWRGYYDFDSGARLLDWGAHTLDLCQWANGADDTTPIEFEPIGDNVIVGCYANGVKIVLRKDGWLGLGTCPVRFEGDVGWVETGDSEHVAVYPESLRSEQTAIARKEPENLVHRKYQWGDGIRPGYKESSDTLGPGLSPRRHIRNFLDCMKSRAAPAANADIARKSHVACHVAYIAWLLRRKVAFDPVREEFIGDDEAWSHHMCHQPGGRLSTGVSWCSPRVLGISSKHHRMICP
jgi:predicted dehydrogenase